MDTTQPLLEVRDLKKYFPVHKHLLDRQPVSVRAVDGVSFDIQRGETLGLVGESGSGKTTIGRLLLGAMPADAGHIHFHLDGGQTVDIRALDSRQMRQYRPYMQMIFQDPYASLNPRMTIRDIIADPLLAMKLAQGSEVDARVVEMARRCQLNIEHLRRFPHAFSGGQRQRISIARALVTEPEFVVCDEAVSALDVSIRAEILNLLQGLQAELGLTYLFISHDLRVVEYVSDRVAVMYLGQLVEIAPTPTLFRAPRHPYTAALISAIPDAEPDRPMQPVALEGEIPSPTQPPAGCRFHTRCRYVQDICRTEIPPWKAYAAGHYAACHFADQLNLSAIQDAASP